MDKINAWPIRREDVIGQIEPDKLELMRRAANKVGGVSVFTLSEEEFNRGENLHLFEGCVPYKINSPQNDLSEFWNEFDRLKAEIADESGEK